MRWFIRGKGSEGYAEADNIQDAFVEYVRDNPVESLGLIIFGHTEYFPKDNVPEEAVATRTTIPLVKAGIWTEEEAKDFNEEICGKRII